ncbi:MAG: hypothetical protein QM582_14205 [Micropruina sp.]|uniref:hypothetical protein n=1 Tax=Micropruina sp. TaxID=2737536 RepID=UPI0039E365C0
MRTLVRAQLRRSRWGLTAWLLLLGLLPALMAVTTAAGYPTQADRDAFAREATANLAEVALRGPVFAPTTGGLVAWTLASSGSLVGCVIALIFIVRLTRSDEQSGRLELELAGRVTRADQLRSALLVVGGAGVLVGVVAFLGLVATGMDPAGSALLGLVLTSTMLFFTAVGALCAQVAADAGAAGGLATITMGVTLLIVAIGDAMGSPLVWASPFGWARHAQAFVANRFWVPLIPLALAGLLAWLALRLNRSRDFGTGMIGLRPGRASAASWIRGPLTLALRLQRGSIIGWTVALGTLGLLLGSVLSGLDQQLAGGTFEEFAQRHGGTVGEVFFQFVLYLLAQIATAAALTAVLTLRRDEAGGLAELVLARPVTRRRWSLVWWLVAAGVGAFILVGIGVGAALSSGRWALPLDTIAYLPAALTVVGLALALVGWAPRIAVATSWAVLGVILLLDLFAEFNLLPSDLVRNLSPFAATFGGLFAGGLPETLLVLGLIGVGLGGFGVLGLRRRDLQPA